MGARVFVCRCSARECYASSTTTSARVPQLRALRARACRVEGCERAPRVEQPRRARVPIVIIVASPSPLHVSVRESR